MYKAGKLKIKSNCMSKREREEYNRLIKNAKQLVFKPGKANQIIIVPEE